MKKRKLWSVNGDKTVREGIAIMRWYEAWWCGRYCCVITSVGALSHRVWGWHGSVHCTAWSARLRILRHEHWKAQTRPIWRHSFLLWESMDIVVPAERVLFIPTLQYQFSSIKIKCSYAWNGTHYESLSFIFTWFEMRCWEKKRNMTLAKKFNWHWNLKKIHF